VESSVPHVHHSINPVSAAHLRISDKLGEVNGIAKSDSVVTRRWDWITAVIAQAFPAI